MKREYNLIEGSNVTITEVDNSTTGQDDVTISATGGSGTTVTKSFFDNTSNVGVATTNTTIAGASNNFNAGSGLSNVWIYAVCGFTNISETLTQRSDLTAFIEIDGTPFQSWPGAYESGAAGQTIGAMLYGPLTFSAGLHTILLRATASAGSGNCRVGSHAGAVVVTSLVP